MKSATSGESLVFAPGKIFEILSAKGSVCEHPENVSAKTRE